MKSNLKIKMLILITLGIIFAFSVIINSNLDFYSDEITTSDNENLKIAKVSRKIDIDGNLEWAAFEAAGNCTGEGTYINPYVIEDLVIDGGGSGDCIRIFNSDVYFKIKNCTLYNATGDGIYLAYVTHGQILDNDCSSNGYGIALTRSPNNTISGNTANNNDYSGILLTNVSYNSTVSGNTANNNNENGIIVLYSDNNTISGNTVNNNDYGMWIFASDYNNITDNSLIGNRHCFYRKACTGNIFENNVCREPAIPGYNIYFLLSLLSIVSILISRKIKKS